jgi:hypothetical protein
MGTSLVHSYSFFVEFFGSDHANCQEHSVNTIIAPTISHCQIERDMLPSHSP